MNKRQEDDSISEPSKPWKSLIFLRKITIFTTSRDVIDLQKETFSRLWKHSEWGLLKSCEKNQATSPLGHQTQIIFWVFWGPRALRIRLCFASWFWSFFKIVKKSSPSQKIILLAQKPEWLGREARWLTLLTWVKLGPNVVGSALLPWHFSRIASRYRSVPPA